MQEGQITYSDLALDKKALYTRATLIRCLKQARHATKIPIVYGIRTILRREEDGVRVYNTYTREPETNYKFYTGKQILKIVMYEIGRKIGEGKTV